MYYFKNSKKNKSINNYKKNLGHKIKKIIILSQNTKSIEIKSQLFKNFTILFNLIFKKKLLLNFKILGPYERLCIVFIKFLQKNIKINLNLSIRSIKIRYYFSSGECDFIEKIYYSKDYCFNINENFEKNIKFLILYNPSGTTLANVKFNFEIKENKIKTSLIYLIKLFYNNFYKYPIYKKINKAVFIVSRPKTGNTSLHINFFKSCIPVARIHFRSYKNLKNNFSLSNPQVGILHSSNLNKQYKDNLREINEYEETLNVINTQFFESMENQYKKKFYIAVFRETISEYLSSIFQTMGNYFEENKVENNQISKIIELDMESYLNFTNENIYKMKNYFPNRLITIEQFKKTDHCLKLSDKDSYYYICALKNLGNFYVKFMKENFKKKTKLVTKNLAKKKKYYIKYNETMSQILKNKKIFAIKDKYKNIKKLETLIDIL